MHVLIMYSLRDRLTGCCADIIIIEDDPYYFLQEGPYIAKELRSKSKTVPLKKGEDEEKRFLDSLVPSYLRYAPIPR